MFLECLLLLVSLLLLEFPATGACTMYMLFLVSAVAGVPMLLKPLLLLDSLLLLLVHNVLGLLLGSFMSLTSLLLLASLRLFPVREVPDIPSIANTSGLQTSLLMLLIGYVPGVSAAAGALFLLLPQLMLPVAYPYPYPINAVINSPLLLASLQCEHAGCIPVHRLQCVHAGCRF
jgi:hypothetical protein